MGILTHRVGSETQEWGYTEGMSYHLDFTTIPLSELLVQHAVGEPLAADPDPLKDTVAAQLVEDQVGIDETRPLHLVGDDAAHKVGVGVAEGGHQAVEGLTVHLRHRDELAPCRGYAKKNCLLQEIGRSLPIEALECPISETITCIVVTSLGGQLNGKKQ